MEDDYRKLSVCNDCEIGNGWKCYFCCVNDIGGENNMNYIYTGEKGVPLKDIIKGLGNKNYKYIECRCKYISENGQEQDVLFGVCSYINGELKALDGDSYSLDDLYIEWEEYTEDESICLTVWEYGYLSDR